VRKAQFGLLFAALLAAGGVGGSRAATPGIPAIYVNYNADCTFALSVDGGITVTSSSGPGPTLPPGTYQLLVNMPNPNQGYTCAKPVFTLSGPGVNDVSTFPGQELHDEQIATLQASSTYLAADASAPAATQKVFSTAASGSNLVLLGSSGTTPSGSTKTSTQPDLVGSQAASLPVVLHATVSKAGAVTLARGERSVSSLKAGRYSIEVRDSDPGAGFFVQARRAKAVQVTGAAFVGKKTRVVAFTPGAWTFFSVATRPSRFTITAVAPAKG
jgi:hypothetical protein